jgi:polysaccharide biosynthesis protein PslH
VVVAPLLAGAGTRIKVIEAMAFGRPVVATSVGVAGLGLVAGRDVLVADTPAEFAASIGAVLNDVGLAQSLVSCGRRAVERFDQGRVVSAAQETLLPLFPPSLSPT